MASSLATTRRKPEISLREFRATIFGMCFASTVAIVGVAVGAAPYSLAFLAAVHQKACNENPVLLAWTQHVLPVMPTVIGLLLLVPVACAILTLVRQITATSTLVSQVQSKSRPMPRKLAIVARSLRMGERVVCVEDRSLYAFCFGLFSPRVCISTGIVRQLSRQELEAVLLHESHHLQNRDPLRLLASRIMASCLVLLPVAKELRERYHLALELSADRKALARIPVEVLASALLKVFTSPHGSPRYQLAAVGALDVTRERIVRLAGKRDTERIPPLPHSSLFVSAFVAFALFVGTAGFAEASGYWESQAHTCRLITSSSMVHATQVGEPKPTTPKCSHSDEPLEIPFGR